MSLAKLTSISTSTLSLLLERQRQQTLPSFSSSSPSPSPTPSKSLHKEQITKNLRELRTGIVRLEADVTDPGQREALGLLRNQYERMRGMLGEEGEGVPSLNSERPSPSPEPSSSSATTFRRGNSSTEALYTPYKDDPEAGRFPLENDEEQDPGVLLQTQQRLMGDQDMHLDNLSQSINRQRDLSLQINDELGTHTGLLEELDTDLDQTAGRLSGARRRLDKVAKGAKQNGSTVMIGAIIFILLILIIVLKT